MTAHRKDSTTGVQDAQDAQDVQDLLDEVHGDGQSRREAAVNHAVGHIERSAYRGYHALRDLAQRGTPRPASAATRPPMPSPFNDPPSDEAAPQAERELATTEPESSEAETRIGAPPAKPEKPRIPDPIEVLSGDGASFRERGHTQTHVIRRPSSWFRRR